MSSSKSAAPPYTIRRSSRARNTRIVVKADRIEVVAPLQVSERNIQAFVNQQQDWIKAAMLRVTEKTQAIPKLAPPHYADGAQIPFQGRRLTLSVHPTSRSRLSIKHHADDGLLVHLPENATTAQSSELIKLGLVRWMQAQARDHASQLIAKHAPRHALFPRSIKIRMQKSRWGSCGPRDDINLNWLLMLAPPEILEYVVVHELCHIRHKNHAAEFWSLLAQHLPDYQQHRLWLKQHGTSLMQGL